MTPEQILEVEASLDRLEKILGTYSAWTDEEVRDAWNDLNRATGRLLHFFRKVNPRAEAVREAHAHLAEVLGPYSGWWSTNREVALAWHALDLAVEALFKEEDEP